MKIEFSLYQLEAKSSLNSRSQLSVREGALLKVCYRNGLIGYADCHPWVELGDLPLKDQLNHLSRRQLTPITRCSLFFARLDAEARAQGISLLEDKAIPSSHFLISNLFACIDKDLEHLIQQGFTHVKIKLGRQLNQEIDYLLNLFDGSSLKLRFDFNESLTEESFKVFLKAIEKIKNQVDFIEDPFPFDPYSWQKIQSNNQISLACDRKMKVSLAWPEAAAILIFKPAIQLKDEVMEVIKDRKVIVTSYLDHPLGQLAAAYAASQLDSPLRNVHGLLSHHCYQINSFSHYLSWQGPQFSTPSGTGFGYDEQLNHLEWQTLI
jgi:O-succinylbenzoate synthase